MHRSLYDAFCQTAVEQAVRPAWLDPCNPSAPPMLWHQFQQDVDRLALWLQKNHVQPSDRIVNLEPNSHRWATLDLACSAIGAIHSPIDPRWSKQHVDLAIKSLEPRIVFSPENPHHSNTKTISIADALILATDSPTKLQIQHWQEQQRTDQTATILWTSGSTADPKGVMLSHANLLSNALAKLDAMPQYADDVRLNLLPFAHAYARTCELTTWYLAGGSMACAASSLALPIAAQSIQPTLINAVPSVFESLLAGFNSSDHPKSLRAMLGGRIRQLASGGAPIDQGIRSRFAHESMTIFQGYGLTEASPVVCSNRTQRTQNGRNIQAILDGVGPPVQSVQCRIDPQGRLWVKGPGIMLGYWRNEQATDEKIKNGWLDTGDCAFYLDNRSKQITEILGIAGRTDDVQVLSTGHKFIPNTLEQLIHQIDGIADCIVIGTGHRRPLAIVRLKESYQVDANTLLQQIRTTLETLPGYLEIAQVILVDEPWTVENGLRHWKGGVNRREITQRLTPK